jgi:hypothetical protein
MRRPSDLFGVNFLEYSEEKFGKDPGSALSHVAADIMARVESLGPR